MFAGRHRLALVAAAVAAGVALAGLYALSDRLRPPPSRPDVAIAAQPTTSAAPNAPEDGGRVLIGWVDKDGIPYRAAVDSARYQEFSAARRQRSEHEHRRLGDAAAARAHAALVPIFKEVEARVPDFGEWAYDWWTSWTLLARSLGWVWDGVRDGPLLTMPDRVQARLVSEIEQRFEMLVLRPGATDPKLVATLDQVLAALSDDLAQECRTYEEALGAFVVREARRLEKRAAGGGWAVVATGDALKSPPAVACAAHGRAEDFLIAEFVRLRQSRHVDDPVNAVILRMSRPFATKLISFVILPAIVTALIGGIALPLLGILPNVISGAVAGALTGAAGAAIIGFSASTSVDWYLNRADERRNRGSFEVQVRRAVIASRDAFEAKLVDAQRRSIELQLQTIADSPSVLSPSR
ncbi:MAG: hypothetical protein EXQ95_09350 [Alphaproteobacteria bacterium]|nr:hypothetical protein [Alphaproteobacteria bacterium]